MNPEELDRLLLTMEEQLALMGDLTALSEKKSEALVKGDLEQLDLLLRGEQALIWQMGRLEEQRFASQTNLAAQIGIHPSQLTLERLVNAVPQEHVQRCHDLAQRYGATAQGLFEINHMNTELIQQAMAYVDFSLQLLGGSSAAAGQIYSPQGRPQDAKQRRLDNRA